MSRRGFGFGQAGFGGFGQQPMQQRPNAPRPTGLQPMQPPAMSAQQPHPGAMLSGGDNPGALGSPPGGGGQTVYGGYDSNSGAVPHFDGGGIPQTYNPQGLAITRRNTGGHPASPPSQPPHPPAPVPGGGGAPGGGTPPPPPPTPTSNSPSWFQQYNQQFNPNIQNPTTGENAFKFSMLHDYSPDLSNNTHIVMQKGRGDIMTPTRVPLPYTPGQFINWTPDSSKPLPAPNPYPNMMHMPGLAQGGQTPSAGPDPRIQSAQQIYQYRQQQFGLSGGGSQQGAGQTPHFAGGGTDVDCAKNPNDPRCTRPGAGGPGAVNVAGAGNGYTTPGAAQPGMGNGMTIPGVAHGGEIPHFDFGGGLEKKKKIGDFASIAPPPPVVGNTPAPAAASNSPSPVMAEAPPSVDNTAAPAPVQVETTPPPRSEPSKDQNNPAQAVLGPSGSAEDKPPQSQPSAPEKAPTAKQTYQDNKSGESVQQKPQPEAATEPAAPSTPQAEAWKPPQETHDPQRILSYLQGANADPNYLKQLNQTVDPSGKMDPHERTLTALDHALKNDGPDKASSALAALQNQYQALMANGAVANQKGDKNKAAESLNHADALLPNGTKTQFDPSHPEGYMAHSADPKTGAPVQVPLNPQQFEDYARKEGQFDTAFTQGPHVGLQKLAQANTGAMTDASPGGSSEPVKMPSVQGTSPPTAQPQNTAALPPQGGQQQPQGAAPSSPPSQSAAPAEPTKQIGDKGWLMDLGKKGLQAAQDYIQGKNSPAQAAGPSPEQQQRDAYNKKIQEDPQLQGFRDYVGKVGPDEFKRQMSEPPEPMRGSQAWEDKQNALESQQDRTDRIMRMHDQMMQQKMKPSEIQKELEQFGIKKDEYRRAIMGGPNGPRSEGEGGGGLGLTRPAHGGELSPQDQRQQAMNQRADQQLAQNNTQRFQEDQARNARADHALEQYKQIQAQKEMHDQAQREAANRQADAARHAEYMSGKQHEQALARQHDAQAHQSDEAAKHRAAQAREAEAARRAAMQRQAAALSAKQAEEEAKLSEAAKARKAAASKADWDRGAAREQADSDRLAKERAANQAASAAHAAKSKNEGRTRFMIKHGLYA